MISDKSAALTKSIIDMRLHHQQKPAANMILNAAPIQSMSPKANNFSKNQYHMSARTSPKGNAISGITTMVVRNEHTRNRNQKQMNKN